MTEQRPNHSPRHRSRASKDIKYWTLFCMIAFILACYGVLVYQLYVWQVRDAESYRAEAVTQQLKDTTLPAVRGSIYSANGKLLAKSSTVWNIVADPSSILESGATEDQIRTAAEHIAELLDDGTTADTVYKALTASNKDTGEPYQYRVVKKGVEKPVADAILAYADSYRLQDGAAGDTSLQTEEKEDKKDGEAKTSKATRILYLTSEQAASRTYPYGEFLASVLGFCNEDGSGAYGLEKYYDETLAGTPGRSVAETDAYGDPLASGQADVHEAIDGSNLNLTIDENVQSIVEEYLTEAMSTFTVHGRGSAIVMNVKTGAILAMASLEQFDPNDPKTITDPKMNEILAKTEIDAEDIDWLESRLGEKAVKDIIADGIISHEKTTNEKGEEVSSEATQLQGMMREAQWKNKNITELYMPGSVFKLITASAGLDSGVMSAEQTFYCGGSLTVNEGSELWEHTYRCANGEVHYEQDMAGALNHSCNLWFIQAAETLKPQIFYDYIQAFGFTQPTGIDLPNETRWTSVYNAEQMAEVDTNLYTAAFGQNESITPMQMATAVAAIANGGYLVTPYVVDSISDKDGNIIGRMLPDGTVVDLNGKPIGKAVETGFVYDKDGNIIPKIKVSENVEKITIPHFKKVYRLYDNDTHKAIADVVTVHDEVIDDSQEYELIDPTFTWKRKKVSNFTAKELLRPIFQGGELVYDLPSIDEIRENCAFHVASLWDEVKRFENPQTYYVDLSERLLNIRSDLLERNKK